ncbi:SagB/ThcOx family dehydrogenase [Anthocerotibacter panamensis]|uniref:SagB/ThcOx family dehydrogenase n=1 Tax=Anthocerotibacter panamensis TaxID=2857077 RepID=UPI001C40703B|nr:SagB/ThcOx family dehydrogenase [Anthocerotibacter panamensis]
MASFCAHYHEKTKYSPEGIARSSRQLEWDSQPIPYKEYLTGQKIDLKSYLPGQNTGEDQPADPSGELGRISKLLYLTYGITAVVPYPGRPFYMRVAPSAGGLYPAEVYLVSRGTPGFPAGLYNYQVLSHSLIHFWDKPAFAALTEDCFNHPALVHTDLVLVVTGVFFRSAWRYEDRAYRRIFLDTGHLLGNLDLAASLSGLNLRLIGGFNDDRLAQLLFLDPGEEGPLCVAALCADAMPLGPTALPSPTCDTFPSLVAGQLLGYLHQVSKMEQPIAPPQPSQREDKYNFPFCLKVSMQTSPIDWQYSLGETIVRRRSTRQYTGEDLTLDELKALLNFTYQTNDYKAQGLAANPDYFDLSLLETFIAVTGVEGLEEGCYYYAPETQELRQVRFKNFRREIHYLCLGQDLGRDAGAVIFHTADLAVAVARYGERAYRYLHLDAGHLGQRLNLAAVRLKLGVSGIGGFFDDQVNEVLGIPEREAVLYITTLGRPAG